MTIDKALVSAVRTGQASREELVRELLRTNSVINLAEALTDYIVYYEDVKPIVVDKSEYDRIVSLFKIRGVRQDGSPENRGKGRKL